MKTALSFLLIFFLLLVISPANAQGGRSYEEWLESAANGGRASKATNTNKAASPKKEAPAESAPMSSPGGMFTGTLPCDDCGGISMELTLNGTPENSNRSFTLKQTFAGKSAATNIVMTSGKWILAKGNKQDPDIVVLQLIPKDNQEPMYFQQISDVEIRLLNRQQGPMSGNRNYSLKKKP